METTLEEMQIHTISLPKYVGGYRIGGIHHSFRIGGGSDWLEINFTYKPSWFHRTMMKICFGIQWFDIKNTEQ